MVFDVENVTLREPTPGVYVENVTLRPPGVCVENLVFMWRT